jgi:hypothetical protein
MRNTDSAHFSDSNKRQGVQEFRRVISEKTPDLMILTFAPGIVAGCLSPHAEHRQRSISATATRDKSSGVQEEDLYKTPDRMIS